MRRTISRQGTGNKEKTDKKVNLTHQCQMQMAMGIFFFITAGGEIMFAAATGTAIS